MTPEPPLPPAPPAVEALLTRLRQVVCERRALDVRAARLLDAVLQAGGLEHEGCASVAQLGERLGMAGREAFMLRSLGLTLGAMPEIEARVLEGSVTVAAAACLAEVVTNGALRRPGDDWIAWAADESQSALRLRVRRRVEEGRAPGEPVVPVTFFVKEQVREDFSRARVIASRKAERALTEGETLEAVTEHYLDSFDEERVTPAARRLPHTAYAEGRYVPVAVRREIRHRQQGRCAVPFCPFDTFLEFAHVVPHRAGGSREADNLVMLCWTHHRMLDDGRLRMEGTAQAPHFYDLQGRRVGERSAGQVHPDPAESIPPVPTELPAASERGSGVSRDVPGGTTPRPNAMPQALEPPDSS